MNIKIKKTLKPYISDGQIIFGHGNISLERRLDTSETLVQIVRYLGGELARVDLDLSDEELAKYLDKLQDKGLLTSNTYDNTARYSRNLNFFEWVDGSPNLDPASYQTKLSQSKVTVIGIGGIGGAVCESLVRAGVGQLCLVDSDVVDASNITRQTVFSNADQGKKKVDASMAYLKTLNPEVVLTSDDRQIAASSDLQSYFEGSDLVVNCADTPAREIDYWVDDWVKKTGTPAVIGSYGSTVVNALVMTKDSIDMRSFYGDNAVTSDLLLKEKSPAAVISPISLLSAGLVAYRAIMVLIGLQTFDEAVQLDLMDWTLTKYALT